MVFGAAATVKFEGFFKRIHSIYEAHLSSPHINHPVRGGDVE
jgi:hypothetical protein